MAPSNDVPSLVPTYDPLRQIDRAEEPRRTVSIVGRMNAKTQSAPWSVVAEDGDVIVDGPDGAAMSMTPDAAFETGGRLIDAAGKRSGRLKPRHEELTFYQSDGRTRILQHQA